MSALLSIKGSVDIIYGGLQLPPIEITRFYIDLRDKFRVTVVFVEKNGAGTVTINDVVLDLSKIEAWRPSHTPFCS